MKSAIEVISQVFSAMSMRNRLVPPPNLCVWAHAILRTSVGRSVDFVLATAEVLYVILAFQSTYKLLLHGLNSSKLNYLIVVEMHHTLIVPEYIYLKLKKKKEKKKWVAHIMRLFRL